MCVLGTFQGKRIPFFVAIQCPLTRVQMTTTEGAAELTKQQHACG